MLAIVGGLVVGRVPDDHGPGATAAARPVDRRRPSPRLRHRRPVAADAPRRDRLRAARDPRFLGHVSVPAGRLGDVLDGGGSGDGPRRPVGGRDRDLVRRVGGCWPTGSTRGSASPARPCCCRSSTSAASACGSSPSRSRPRRSSGSPSRSPSAASRTPPGARSTTWSRASVEPRCWPSTTACPGQVGTILSGFLLLAAGTLLALDQVFWLGVITALVCTVVVVGIRRRYRASVAARALRTGLAEQVLEGGPGQRRACPRPGRQRHARRPRSGHPSPRSG